jgi:hypothetical protein
LGMLFLGEQLGPGVDHQGGDGGHAVI